MLKSFAWPLALSLFAWGCQFQSPVELEVGDESSLIPLPSKMEVDSSSMPVPIQQVHWLIPDGWQDSLALASAWVFPQGEPQAGASTSIALHVSDGWGAEGYQLVINSGGVNLTATTAEGAFRGLTTLRQLTPLACLKPGACKSGFAWPAVVIEDAPHFEHRGLLLDVCRHFMEVEFLEQILDGLALHKFNVLHWHLTEDQGWRIAIDAYPALTEVGAWRTEADGTQHGGFYTKEEIRHVVEYAAARHITVIPEIELPGHSRAALAAYPELSCTGDSLPVPHDWGVFKDIYCAGNEKTFRFLEAVMAEVLELFPSKYIHIGGDEAPKVRWENCMRCQRRMAKEGLHDEHELQSYFIGRMGEWLDQQGRTLIGWDEILEGGLPEGATVQSWRGLEGARKAIAMGHDAILSPTSHCYLDYPLAATDLEEVYGFDPGSVKGGPGRVLGGEVNMWSEHAPQHLVESKVYPRAVAFAEVMWTAPELRELSEFLDRLDLHYDRLDAMGVDYGLETVPVTMEPRLDKTTGSLSAQIQPAMRGVTGAAGFVPLGANRPDSIIEWGADIPIQGEGEIWTEVEHRYRLLTEPPRFPVAGHLGLTASSVSIGHAINAFYPGGGNRGLVDGLKGSMDFRDGCWQATSGEDMEVEIQFASPVHVDSITLHTYLYQDAWIFDPEKIEVLWKTEAGATWVGTERVVVQPLAPNDKQGIQRWSLPVGQGLVAIRLRAVNPGPCPAWHDAATERTWMFLDEVILH